MNYYPSRLGSDQAEDAASRRAAFRDRLAREREMLARMPRLDLDIDIPGLLPGRYLRINTLTVIDAEGYNVVRLAYEVVPIDEPPTRESAEVSLAVGPHRWFLSGRDDMGTEYRDWGGTYGVPKDGVLADGERDLYPAPPAGATWLEIAFHAAGEPESFEQARYVLKVALPLVAASHTSNETATTMRSS